MINLKFGANLHKKPQLETKTGVKLEKIVRFCIFFATFSISAMNFQIKCSIFAG